MTRGRPGGNWLRAKPARLRKDSKKHKKTLGAEGKPLTRVMRGITAQRAFLLLRRSPGFFADGPVFFPVGRSHPAGQEQASPAGLSLD